MLLLGIVSKSLSRNLKKFKQLTFNLFSPGSMRKHLDFLFSGGKDRIELIRLNSLKFQMNLEMIPFYNQQQINII